MFKGDGKFKKKSYMSLLWSIQPHSVSVRARARAKNPNDPIQTKVLVFYRQLSIESNILITAGLVL